MADQDTLTLGTLNYWCREKQYTKMQNFAIETQKKYANDPILKYFNALGSILGGVRVKDGLRELDALSNKADVNICSLLTLIHAYRMSQNVDKDAITMLDSRLKMERKQASDKALYFAGLFLVHTEKYEKAREYVDRALKMNSRSADTLALKGWLEMLGGDEASSKKAVKFFDDALAMEGIKSPDALFGKAKFLELRRNYDQALDITSRAMVSYTNFLPGFIEKMKLQLALQDWEQCIDTARRALEINPRCLQAKRFIILQLLCRDGNYPEAAGQLESLYKDFIVEEPQNAQLFHEYASVFCRVSGRNPLVLQQTYIYQERAQSINSANPAYVAELGYELLAAGRPKDAIKCYRSALKLDETSLLALTGLLHCQLLDNQLDDAASQLELLHELKDSVGTSAELIYLNALLGMKRNQPGEKAIGLLNKAIDTHFMGLKGLPLSTEYFAALNPIFLTQAVSDYLSYAPQLPLGKGEPPNPVLQRCLAVLDPLCKAMPGLLDCLYMMGKAKFLAGDIDSASGLLQRCLEQDSTMSDCHILMAQIHLHSNNMKAASQSLEIGLSYNFEVREHPVYHLIKARILKKQGELQEAVKTLQQAMLLPGVRVTENRSVAAGSKKKAQISTNDRVSLYIELADTHRLLGEQPEAAKVMQDAINNFQGTGEEVRITIANVDLALARNDVDGALEMLRGIGADQAYFVQAREKMANIYLQHRKDKRLYVSCYRELYEKCPSTQTNLLLGDAFMKIQEPEKAIDVYESALKKNPKDAVLASKIGQALVKTHQFAKAISYYEAALKQGGQPFLRYDLAELLLRLKMFDKAEKLLRQVLDQSEDGANVETAGEYAKYNYLLSLVYEQQGGRYSEQLQYLTKAKEIQDRVMMHGSSGDQSEAINDLRKFSSTVCSKMATVHIEQRELDKAIHCYREALSHTEGDSNIMLELAKLYMMTDDLDSCRQQCQLMIQGGHEKDAAGIMLADIMFRMNDYDQAMSKLKQLLHEKPDNYAGLERIIELLRRAGKLEECQQFLDLAEKSSSHAAIDAGFNFCAGLYSWYTGNPSKALRLFNKARKDSDYGSVATYNMVMICINPDNETIGGELFDSSSQSDPAEAQQKAESNKAALKTADILLRELKPKPNEQRHRVLSNLLLLATKHKNNIEQALGNFADMAKNGKESVAVLYSMAVGFLMLKQTQNGRKTLARLATLPWSMDEAEYLEASWLLLADTSIVAGKHEEARDALLRCLQYNKSCCKAYEYLGHITEKEQQFKEAAEFYEKAWRYSNKNDPGVGYKLAFNYLKSRRFVETIDICRHVLNAHPTYPKIRKEILEKAQLSIRA